MRYPSTKEDKPHSLQSYIDSAKQLDEKDQPIFYCVAPNKEIALESPYMASYVKNDIEVMLLFQPIDEFVMNHLGQYKNRKLMSIDSSEASEAMKSLLTKEETINVKEQEEMTEWVKQVLGMKIKDISVKIS